VPILFDSDEREREVRPCLLALRPMPARAVVKHLQMDLVKLDPWRELDQQQQLLVHVALQKVILFTYDHR
jgi:hypothetical protein